MNDTRRYTFANDEFSLEAAYHDCRLVFDGITDDDSFQEADTGVILYYANEIIYALQEALEGKDTNVPTNDYISRQAALDGKISIQRADGVEIYSDEAVPVEYLKNLPSAQQWIPCSERLPAPNEMGGDGFVKAYLVKTARLMSVARWDGKFWVLWGYSLVLDHVVAWMPLPEYKEEKEE